MTCFNIEPDVTNVSHLCFSSHKNSQGRNEQSVVVALNGVAMLREYKSISPNSKTMSSVVVCPSIVDDTRTLGFGPRRDCEDRILPISIRVCQSSTLDTLLRNLG